MIELVHVAALYVGICGCLRSASRTCYPMRWGEEAPFADTIRNGSEVPLPEFNVACKIHLLP